MSRNSGLSAVTKKLAGVVICICKAKSENRRRRRHGVGRLKFKHTRFNCILLCIRLLTAFRSNQIVDSGGQACPYKDEGGDSSPL